MTQLILYNRQDGQSSIQLRAEVVVKYWVTTAIESVGL